MTKVTSPKDNRGLVRVIDGERMLLLWPDQSIVVNTGSSVSCSVVGDIVIEERIRTPQE